MSKEGGWYQVSGWVYSEDGSLSKARLESLTLNIQPSQPEEIKKPKCNSDGPSRACKHIFDIHLQKPCRKCIRCHKHSTSSKTKG